MPGTWGRLVDVQERVDIGCVIRHLHGLVTYGPGDLDIAWAMSQHGYDAVKWAEGQCMLAELVSSEKPAAASVAYAIGWCEEATSAAKRALPTHLLTKLGLEVRKSE